MPKVTRQNHQRPSRSEPLAPNNSALNQNSISSSTPHHTRSKSNSHQHLTSKQSISVPMPQLTPSQQQHALAQTYYSTHHTTMQQSQPTYHHQTQTQVQQAYQQGGPVQHPQTLPSQQYTHIQSAPQQQAQQPPPSHSLRPSSGAWNPNDDQTLMTARAQGMNWAPIQAAYFPSKTPNACRKRHERLMERRSATDWDGIKLENLAKNYMSMRREIWSGLAAQTGEKWAVVEAKCMASGLKNLQAAARSGARRERMSGAGAYTDDSGIGLELTGEEDGLDGDGGDVGEGEYADSDGSVGGQGGYGMGQYQGHGGHGHGRRPQYQQRLPSMDMGIGAIINRNN